ncbi:MAG: zf-HC2 domain-containing protein, partial [Acidobacteriota bacterium]
MSTSAENQRDRDHPPVERLLAYSRRELRASETEALRDHLTDCAACRELLLEAEGFAPGQEPEISGDQRQAAWDRLQAHRRTAPSPGSETPAGVRSPSSSIRRSIAWVGIAAAILLAFAAGFWWPRPSTEIATSVAALDLLPHEFTRGVAAERPRVSRAVELYYVNFHLPPDSQFSEFRLTLVGQGGQTIRTVDGLTPTPLGTTVVLLPVAALPTGVIELRLLGLDSGSAHEVERYEIEVVE